MRNQNQNNMKRDAATASTCPFSLENGFSQDVKKNLTFVKDQIITRLKELAELNVQKKTKITHQSAQPQSDFSSKYSK
jgi:hypothetical protein